jgi:hypothetical protein
MFSLCQLVIVSWSLVGPCLRHAAATRLLFLLCIKDTNCLWVGADGKARHVARNRMLVLTYLLLVYQNLDVECDWTESSWEHCLHLVIYKIVQ